MDDFSNLLEEFKNHPYLETYPEFAINKLLNLKLKSDNRAGLSKPKVSSLEKLKPVEERTTEDVIVWLKNNLNYKTLVYVGW
jgi:hypothetical protein